VWHAARQETDCVASGGVQICAVPDFNALAEILQNDTAVSYFAHRARSGREHFYRAAAPTGLHLVSVERNRAGYRLKEVRKSGGGAASGDVLVAVSDWLGRAQGRYR
jgi:hypothetical protein